MWQCLSPPICLEQITKNRGEDPVAVASKHGSGILRRRTPLPAIRIIPRKREWFFRARQQL
jgi:hypothetical protein